MKVQIFKVQLPLNSGQKVALVYNKDRSLLFQGEVDGDILKNMDGEYKKFFYGSVEKGEISLGKEAPWQNW